MTRSGGIFSLQKIYNRQVSKTWPTTATVLSDLSVEYLIVAGGGGGGQNTGGGGGAGGFRTGAGLSLLSGTSYTVTVGGGGASSTSGTNSVFNTFTSAGGGHGGSNISGPNSGTAGGSGGGGSNGNGIGGAGNTPSTSPSQGNNGGNSGPWTGNYPCGGGGGASAVGASPSTSSSNGGAGGNGTASTISGLSVTYAGGGGGAVFQSGTGGPGGTGGGGNGTSGTGGSGTANRGGGGGGGGNNGTNNGGPGGSGVVILKYSNTYTISNPGGGLTFTTSTEVSGFKVTTFTQGTGNIQFTFTGTYVEPTFSLFMGGSSGIPAGTTVTASSTIDTRTGDKAFDNALDEEGKCWHTSTSWNPATLSINFGSTPRAISRYRIFARATNDWKPTAWTLEGSTNNSTWTTLDTRSGVTIPNVTSTSVATQLSLGNYGQFDVGSPASFQYYRFRFTGSSGNSYLVIGEILLYTS